jgi:peptidoglycan/LPS O-acetylase OafA/YrhL
MTLETAVKRSNNNYGLIRLIAALLVVIGHAFASFKGYGYIDPFRAWLHFDYSGSCGGVYLFLF